MTSPWGHCYWQCKWYVDWLLSVAFSYFNSVFRLNALSSIARKWGRRYRIRISLYLTSQSRIMGTSTSVTRTRRLAQHLSEFNVWPSFPKLRRRWARTSGPRCTEISPREEEGAAGLQYHPCWQWEFYWRSWCQLHHVIIINNIFHPSQSITMYQSCFTRLSLFAYCLLLKLISKLSLMEFVVAQHPCFQDFALHHSSITPTYSDTVNASLWLKSPVNHNSCQWVLPHIRLFTIQWPSKPILNAHFNHLPVLEAK